MCLLVLSKEAHQLSTAEAEAAARSNPHGFGVAWHDGTRWQLRKTMQLTTHFEHLKEAEGYRALVHYRMATHGVRDESNVHPFLVGAPDDPNAFVVGHNGVFDIASPHREDPRSDTRLMVEHVLAQLKTGWREDAVLRRQLQELFGYNRVVAMWPDHHYIVFSEKSGHWNPDTSAWFSNYAYRPAPPVQKASSQLLLPGISSVRHGPLAHSRYVQGHMQYFCTACFGHRTSMDRTNAYPLYENAVRSLQHHSCWMCRRSFKELLHAAERGITWV